MKAICYNWEDNEQSGTHELAVFSNDADVNILRILDELRQKYPLLKEQFTVMDYTPPLLNPKSIDQLDDENYFEWQQDKRRPRRSSDILDYFPKRELKPGTNVGFDLDGKEIF